MSTKTKFYTVAVSAKDLEKKPLKLDLNNKGYNDIMLGEYEVVGVFREFFQAKEVFDMVSVDVENEIGYIASRAKYAIFESEDFHEADIKNVEAALGNDLDYFTAIGGEIDMKFLKQLMPSEFEMNDILLGRERISEICD